MCDSSLAIAELGYKNTPIEVLVTDTYNWLAAAGLLNDSGTN
jgi:hypothetical protein